MVVVGRSGGGADCGERAGDPNGSLLHPGQVDDLCRRGDLAELVAANSPLGPDQAAERLGVRRTDFDHMRRLGWISGVWRSNMRSRRDRLTPEQQAALDELGL
ncbi:hypothetical protein [Streptomyces sp. 8K308]|uniref:hypothetical protein n=1 Tax=Streptomyces sp. 8K308 TaxID=2530388 RepID=UPI001FB78C5F|nr:hypothetical protein [Streptomyces sp. 8K308]